MWGLLGSVVVVRKEEGEREEVKQRRRERTRVDLSPSSRRATACLDSFYGSAYLLLNG